MRVGPEMPDEVVALQVRHVQVEDEQVEGLRENGAFGLAPVNGASYQLGAIAPVGPRNVDGPVAIVWTYARPRRQMATTVNPFPVTSSDVLADVPDLAVFVEEGHTYKVSAVVFAQCALGDGSRVALQSASIVLGVANLVYSFFAVTAPSAVNAYAFSVFGDPANVIVETSGNGWWKIEGTFEATAGGVLTVQYAQAVSSPAASTALPGAYLEIIEQ